MGAGLYAADVDGPNAPLGSGTDGAAARCGLGSRHRQTAELTVTDEMVSILDGNTFVVSDSRGDIEASPTQPTGQEARREQGGGTSARPEPRDVRE